MKIQKLKQSRLRKLKVFIALLVLAGVGSYLLVASRAAPDSYISPGRLYWWDVGKDIIVPLGSTINGRINIHPDHLNPAQLPAPQSSVYLLFNYNPEMIRFIGSTCVWEYGCTAKVGNDLYYDALPDYPDFKDKRNQRKIYKAQVILCFNIPANPSWPDLRLAATYQFKRTNKPMPHYTNANPDGPPIEDWVGMHRDVVVGERQGSCESNPGFKDVWFEGNGTCGVKNTADVPPCNDLSDPGAGGAGLTGFGNGGNGSGGEGTGDNGVGTGPGAGSGGGGGGSSANKQSNEPNSLPSPSPQGENEQTELDPDPFFDGKDFERGSDTDNLVFGNSTIGGKKVPKILLYLLSAVLLGGAGGALYWRWKRR